MSHTESVRKTFDDWAVADGAKKMGDEHWPRVQKIWNEFGELDGSYLEIGPGNGYALEHAASQVFRRGLCYGVELSEEMASLSRSRLATVDNAKVVVGNFLDWTPPSELLFRLIFSMEVFYYLKDITTNIRKCVDLLEERGELIIMVDYFKENTSSHHWPDELGLELTLWSMSDYHRAFEEAGLSNVEQVLVNGGDTEEGMTLCTRGRKGEWIKY